MITNPKSKSVAARSAIQNPKLSKRRLTAFSLFSLHTTTYTLVSTVLIWTANSEFVAAKTISQKPNGVPSTTVSPQFPDDRTQLPALTPNQPYNPENTPIQPPLEPSLPLETNPPSQFKTYRLGIGDTISIIVQRFPDLSFQAIIDLEGNVYAPLLGKVSLVGLTLEEAKERIRFGLNRYVIDPEVNAVLLLQRPAQVTIIGEVTRPGFYPLGSNSQLSAALLVAGGATTMADLRAVTVRRSLVDGSIIEQKVDLFTPLQNGQPLPELRLQDGDAVVIPKLEIGNTRDYDRSLISRSSLSQPQITVRVLSYATNGIGNVSLPNGSNFLDALTAIAPDPDNANLKQVALIRFDPEQGKAVTQNIDAKKVLLGDVTQNVPLQNNDVIVVGRSLIAKLTYALNRFTQPFRDVLGFLLFFDSLRDSASGLFRPNGSRD